MILEIDRRVVKPFFAVLIAFSTWCAGPAPAEARDRLRLPAAFTQHQLEKLIIELGQAIAFTPAAPAEALGATALEIGPQVTAVWINHRADYWTATLEDDPPGVLVLPKFQIQKGLPIGLDVGVQYARAIGQEIGLAGAELKWEVWRGSSVRPAVALSLNYSRLLGVNDLVLEHWGAAVAVSRSVAWVTPYAGFGPALIRGRDHDAGLALAPVREFDYRGMVGVKLWLVRLSLAAEVSISRAPAASLRLNFAL